MKSLNLVVLALLAVFALPSFAALDEEAILNYARTYFKRIFDESHPDGRYSFQIGERLSGRENAMMRYISEYPQRYDGNWYPKEIWEVYTGTHGKVIAAALPAEVSMGQIAYLRHGRDEVIVAIGYLPPLQGGGVGMPQYTRHGLFNFPGEWGVEQFGGVMRHVPTKKLKNVFLDRDAPPAQNAITD